LKTRKSKKISRKTAHSEREILFCEKHFPDMFHQYTSSYTVEKNQATKETRMRGNDNVSSFSQFTTA